MKNIMVCVTLQNTCEKLISSAHTLLDPDGRLFVLHVARNGQSIMGGDDNAAALEYLFSVSHEFGADMTVEYADDVQAAIVTFIREHNITTAVLGAPGKGEKDTGVLRKLGSLLPETVELIILNKQEL